MKKHKLCSVCATGLRGMELNGSVPEMEAPDEWVREQVPL
jgi:hypothetical protein